MKIQEVYNYLKENTSNFKDDLSFTKVLELESKLKNAILLEELKTTTTKQRAQKCFNLQKKLEKSHRPVLAGTCMDQLENAQIFTDGYFLVCLKDSDILSGLKTYQETAPGCKYPSVAEAGFNYVKTVDEIKSFSYSVTLNINKLLKYFLLDEILCINSKVKSLYGDTMYLGIARDNFKNFITFMNYKESENITLYWNVSKGENVITPLYAIRENTGSTGLILPYRFEDIHSQEKIIDIETLQED